MYERTEGCGERNILGECDHTRHLGVAVGPLIERVAAIRCCGDVDRAVLNERIAVSLSVAGHTRCVDETTFACLNRDSVVRYLLESCGDMEVTIEFDDDGSTLVAK